MRSRFLGRLSPDEILGVSSFLVGPMAFWLVRIVCYPVR
jgi:hypothetical protein